jgi:hypothetical protein
MNLDDVVLLRGWINHIEWNELDSQIPEARASSRKRIKDLRRQLAMKARFYGKPEHVEFWLGERGHTETWERLLLWAVLLVARRSLRSIPMIAGPISSF